MKNSVDERNKVTPGQWIAATLSAIIFLSGLVMSVRASDLQNINEVQRDHATRIRFLETSLATLAQKQADLVDLINRYISASHK